jgi:hypothetical protein
MLPVLSPFVDQSRCGDAPGIGNVRRIRGQRQRLGTATRRQGTSDWHKVVASPTQSGKEQQ